MYSLTLDFHKPCGLFCKSKTDHKSPSFIRLLTRELGLAFQNLVGLTRWFFSEMFSILCNGNMQILAPRGQCRLLKRGVLQNKFPKTAF